MGKVLLPRCLKLCPAQVWASLQPLWAARAGICAPHENAAPKTMLGFPSAAARRYSFWWAWNETAASSSFIIPSFKSKIRFSLLLTHLWKHLLGCCKIKNPQWLSQHHLLPVLPQVGVFSFYGPDGNPLPRSSILWRFWLLPPLAMLSLPSWDHRLDIY